MTTGIHPFRAAGKPSQAVVIHEPAAQRGRIERLKYNGPKDWTHMGHGWGEDCANQLNAHSKATAHTLADFAYQIADAMLAERDKTK